MSRVEANLDGLIGPTHNYAGLSFGNIASETYAGRISNPRAAALQGLAKMQIVMELGVPQFVMPPHPRPNSHLLHQLGFRGSIRKQIEQVVRNTPELSPYIYSSSGMWAANAATVCPSIDSADGKVHFTPANLISTPHRALEKDFSSLLLRTIFSDKTHFVHHAALPSSLLLSDEGAANHMQLDVEGGGLHIFVYGRVGMDNTPARYPARQTLLASQAIARLHGLNEKKAIFLRQHPRAIDAGVFHNDVISTSHENILLYHEAAFAEGDSAIDIIQKLAGPELCLVRFEESQLSLQEAVKTYLFNSQILHTSTGYVVIAPAECQSSKSAHASLQALCADVTNPISRVIYADLRESMQNGGGPACLRLRVPLEKDELSAVHAHVVLTPTLYTELCNWVEKHYREYLAPDDLRDPLLAEEAHTALDALSNILHLGNIYDFQHE